MSLKQLRLASQIKAKRNEINALFESEEEYIQLRDSFKTREQKLREALEQAETEEDVELVNDSLDELENDSKEFNEKEETKKKLEEEVAELEVELDELNEEAPKNNEEDVRNKGTTIITRESVGMKVNRGFFKGMERSVADEFVQREEVKKFLTDVREGNILSESQQKRAVDGAGLGIPDTVLGLIRDNLHRYSKLISKVNLRALKGTARTNIVGEIPEAIWTEACATLNELDLKFHQIEVDGYKVGGFVAVCNATIEDTDFNLASEILDAIGQAIGIAVDKAILYGTGKKMPVGIVTMLAAKEKPAYWGDKSPTWKDVSTTNIKKISEEKAEELFAEIIRASGAAKANYGTGNKFWAMNENTFTEIQARLVTFNASGSIVAGVNNTMPIIGGDIVLLPFMKNGDIVGGYGSQYILVERAGSQFAKSEHVQFIQDNTVYKGTARYDGRPIVNNGFVAFNIENKDVTTEVTFAPDTANEEEDSGN